jgi:hypothetical protein
MKPGLSISKSLAQIKADAAEHIAVEASRLARIANTNEFGLLAHLIEMVVLEAWREATESETAEPAFQSVDGV